MSTVLSEILIYEGLLVSLTNGLYIQTKTMNMRMFQVAAVFIVLIIGGHTALAQNNSTLTDKLNSLYRDNKKIELFKTFDRELKKSNKTENFLSQLNWLHNKTYNDSRTFRVPTYYALYLKKAGFDEEAANIMLFAFLQQQIDFRRCKYPRRANGKYNHWHQAMLGSRILDPHVRNSNNEVVKKNLEFAIELESKNRHRAGDAWLCGGVNWTKWAERNGRIAGKEVTSTENLGKTIEVNPGDEFQYPTEYIDDTEFENKRKELIESFLERFTDYALEFTDYFDRSSADPKNYKDN